MFMMIRCFPLKTKTIIPWPYLYGDVVFRVQHYNQLMNRKCATYTDNSTYMIYLTSSLQVLQTTNPDPRTIHHQLLHNMLECTTDDTMVEDHVNQVYQ